MMIPTAYFRIRIWKILFLILFTNIFGGSVAAGTFNFLQMSSDELLSIGQNYSKKPETIDSAIMTLSVLTDRNTSRISKEEKVRMIKAHETLWEIYFFNFYDCAKASEHLNRALSICDEIGEDKSNIYLSIGMMNHSLEDSSAIEDLLPEAKRYYIMAIEEAVRNSNYDVASVALMNLIGIAKQLDQLPAIEPQLKLVHDLISNYDCPENAKLNYNYADNLFKALTYMNRGKYDLSIDRLSSMLEAARTEEAGNISKKANILFMRSEAYTRMGNIQAGIKDLMEIRDISDTPERYDIKISALRRLSDNYEMEGNTREAMKLKTEYYSLKDSLLGFRQLASVNELHVLERIHAMNKEIVTIKQRNQITTIVVFLVLAITLFISVAFYIVRKKKIVISNAYRDLYRKNVELLKAEEVHLKQRKLWEEEKETYDRLLTPVSTNETIADKPVSERSESEASLVKYQGSTLDEKTKARLMDRVTELMNNEEVICSMDFSSERLSQLIGVPYKYLSQVINEIYGGNFNALVNTYRIKAACKIMSSEKGQAMTVEGIANAVGFKSRSAFGRVFKSISGLSPSDYIKMAKQEKLNNTDSDDSIQEMEQ